MNPIRLTVILTAVAGLCFGSGPAAAGKTPVPDKKTLLAMEQRLATIKDPAAKLFFRANLEQLKGNPEQAIQTLSKLIIHHADSEKWIARSEMMSAELYLELGLVDAAEVTAQQVELLYEGTEFAEKAKALQTKIAQLKSADETSKKNK